MEQYNTYKNQFKNVPFGNSIFQITTFGHGQETPERQYRNCLLQLDKKLKALQECKFRRVRLEIDIEELRDKFINENNVYGKRRIEVDIEEKTYCLESEIKLIEDALIEVAVYADILKKLPAFTREEFERAEAKYWKKRLLSDMENEVVSTGHVNHDTIKSLGQIGISVGRNEKGQIAYIEKTTVVEQDKNSGILKLF